ncbi:MAG: metallophosphoesterase family protein [Alphaproteobacteria bacterium]
MGNAPIRIGVISDTHLSPVYGFFYTNFRAVVTALDAMAPDIVINAGDLCVDGAGSEVDLAFAAACHRRIGAPLYCVPGNHDIGDHASYTHVKQPVNEERIDRYARHFGPGYWAVEAGAWTLIGLDCLAFETGTAKEAAQWAWLADTVGRIGDRPVGLIIHKPLHVDIPDLDDNLPLVVRQGASRARLEALLTPLDWRFVISGHLHQSLRRRVDGVEHIWAPSTAFRSSQLKGPSDPELGMMVLTLMDRDYECTLLRPEGLISRDLDDIKEHGRYTWLRDMPPSPPSGAPELGEIEQA